MFCRSTCVFPGSRLVGVGLAAALLVAGSAARPRAAAPAACSAAQGQLFIEQGQYDKAIKEFGCVINDQPTEVEGYRGRIEAELLAGRYSDAVRDYARVTAFVEPVHPDAEIIILSGYGDRLAVNPQDIAALTGASFAEWWYFDYLQAVGFLNDLLAIQPDNPYGNLFRGSSRLLKGASPAAGAADLEYGIALDPDNPHVHYIAADAYTYGPSDPERAFAEATEAMAGGLDTPRLRAILAAAYLAFGDLAAAGAQIEAHLDLVTTELITTSALAEGNSMTLDLVPGRTYEIPVDVVAGETLSILTRSHDMWDTILVLLGPDGTPVLGSDDGWLYYAAFDWVAETTGTYRVRVTSFESVNTGALQVSRK